MQVNAAYACFEKEQNCEAFANGYTPWVSAIVGDLAGNKPHMPTVYTWHVADETAGGKYARGSFKYKTSGPGGYKAASSWTAVTTTQRSQEVSGMELSGKYMFEVVAQDKFGNINDTFSNSIDWQVDRDGPVCDLTDGYELVTIGVHLTGYLVRPLMPCTSHPGSIRSSA